jgi:uncharacterized protein YndB with AHSA1/START domain
MTMDDVRTPGLEPDRASRHSVGIHASPAEVFAALTDPSLLACWFVSEATMDLRPGGSYCWVFGEATAAPGPDPSVVRGEVVEVKPQERLELCPVIEGEPTRLEFRLDAWRDGSVLTATHSGFPGDSSWDDIFRSMDQGWASELQILKLYLERARGMTRRSSFHEARLPATPEELFDRLITPAGLESWLAQGAATDPTPGGELRLEWIDRPPLTGHFAVCDPDRFLLMTWEGAAPAAVRIWLQETEEGGETELSLEHRQFLPAAGSTGMFDWEAALQRLRDAVTPGGGGKPC